jgi:hypothetical protein
MEKSTVLVQAPNCLEAASKILELLQDMKVSATSVAYHTGVCAVTLSRWRHKRVIPQRVAYFRLVQFAKTKGIEVKMNSWSPIRRREISVRLTRPVSGRQRATVLYRKQA